VVHWKNGLLQMLDHNPYRCYLTYIFITWLTVSQLKVWVIDKSWKHVWIQRPKIQTKQKLFLMGQNLCYSGEASKHKHTHTHKINCQKQERS
jgi:hypothetical protein